MSSFSYYCHFFILFLYRNPSQFTTRARDNDSTSNLVRHVKECDGKHAPDEQAITKFARGSTYDKAHFRYLVTCWVTQCHRPFSIVSDPPLQKMFQMLYSKVDIPSDTTVSRDVREVYQLAKKHVSKVLQVWFSRRWHCPSFTHFCSLC